MATLDKDKVKTITLEANSKRTLQNWKLKLNTVKTKQLPRKSLQNNHPVTVIDNETSSSDSSIKPKGIISMCSDDDIFKIRLPRKISAPPTQNNITQNNFIDIQQFSTNRRFCSSKPSLPVISNHIKHKTNTATIKNATATATTATTPTTIQIPIQKKEKTYHIQTKNRKYNNKTQWKDNSNIPMNSIQKHLQSNNIQLSKKAPEKLYRDLFMCYHMNYHANINII